MLRLPGGGGGRRRGSSGSGSRLGSALASATPDLDLGEYVDEIEAAANTDYKLSAGLEVERPGIDGRSVYYLRRGGHRVGIRKVSKIISDRAGHFVATQNELRLYNELSRHADFNNHVVPFRGGGETMSLIYLDFGLLPGATLHDKGPSHTKAGPLLAGAAGALKWLAEKGYTHGDIKADNIYITDEGRVLLLDFGLAKRMGPVQAFHDRKAFVAMALPYLSPARQVALEMLLKAAPFGGEHIAFYNKAIQLFMQQKRHKTRKTTRGRRRTHRR